jgi:hypothetical protein
MGKGIRYEERLDHENRCTARNRAGKPCGAYAVRGGRVCRVHGGSAPGVIAAAKRRLAVMAEAAAGRLAPLTTACPSTPALAATNSILDRAGLTPIVATRVGDVATDDNCVIDRIQPANFTNGTGKAASSTVYVYLNCYANVASTTQPGYSLQSPLGKAAHDAEVQQQQQSEQNVTAQNRH